MGEYGNRGFRGGSRGGSSFGRRQGGFGGGGRSGGSFGQERSFAPVKVGEEIDVTIEAVAAKGDGVAKKEGFVIFVPGTKVGDKVRIRVTKVSRRLGFGEVIGQSDGGSEEQPAVEEPAQEESYEDSENFGEEESQEPAEQPSEDEEQQY